MNNQIYEAISNTIISNPNLSRDEIYIKINDLLRTNTEYMMQIRERLKTQENETKLIDLTNLIEDESAPLKYQSFVSIYSNLKRRLMFKTSQWRKLKENSLDFSNKYKEKQSKKQTDLIKQNRSAADIMTDNIILELANEYNVAPFLMVRLILEGLSKMNNIQMIDYDENTDKIPKKDKVTISQVIRESFMLKDERLSSEIIECCAIDDDYGPLIDSIKNLSGLKYENILEKILNERNISFIKESELREKGFDKTPDFKLEVPIALKNGVIISWIDSKCSFGDKTTHAEYYETQFKCYLNRFGSGLVIYWLGFVKEIETSFTSMSDRSVIVCDHFPKDFKIIDFSSFTYDI